MTVTRLRNDVLGSFLESGGGVMEPHVVSTPPGLRGNLSPSGGTNMYYHFHVGLVKDMPPMLH
jgi:hypothetical protein